MKARCLVVGMMLTASAVAGAKEPLSNHVSPAVAFAPANLVIRTGLEPHAENRSMEVGGDWLLAAGATSIFPTASKSVLGRGIDSA